MKMKHENELCMKFSLDIQRRVCKPKLLIVSDFRDARVVKDMATGKSKGYGFVSFFNKWVSSIKSACAIEERTKMFISFRLLVISVIYHLFISLIISTLTRWYLLSPVWLFSQHLFSTLGFAGGSDGKESPAMQETGVRSLGLEDPLEKGMATLSSIFAWWILGTKGSGRLYSPRAHKELDTTEQLSTCI